MKGKFLFVVLALAGMVKGYTQGTVNFGNNFSCLVCLYPNTTVPVGSAFQAELMFAPDGTPVGQFDALATRLGASATFSIPGIFLGGARTAPTAVPGGFGLFQVRVWESAYGSDYRSTVLSGNPNARVGISGILRVDTGDPTTTPAGTPTLLTTSGLQSFTVGGPLGGNINCVPEPSTMALLALAACGLWLLRRRV